MFLGILLASIAELTLGQAQTKYARPELLIEASELAKPDVHRSFVILDARSQDKYKDRHIPNAISVDADAWSKMFYAKQDPEVWAKKIGDLGIGNKSKVVVYDDAKAKDAARVWFILTYWGVKDVRLLNGGWTSWPGEELATKATIPEPTTFTVSKPRSHRLADQEGVVSAIRKKSQILDVRSEGEYCGDEKLKNKRAGHLPGAVHLEWTKVLEPKDHRFKSAEALAKLFEDAGIDLKRSTVTHCQSGGRASVMTFALELMGAGEVANYYRGWSEWGNSDNPIESSPRKK